MKSPQYKLSAGTCSHFFNMSNDKYNERFVFQPYLEGELRKLYIHCLSDLGHVKAMQKIHLTNKQAFHT